MSKGRCLKVRVDGGRKMGMGHIIRCLSLSKAVCSFFDKITFFIEQAEESTISLIKEEGFDIFSLQNGQDFLLHLSNDDFVLLDGYHFAAQYELAIKNKGCKVITVDDLQHRKFYADVVINHTPGVSQQNYIAEPYTKIYSGLKYALIRQEFIRAARRKKAPETLSKAFVCFGGADPENYTLQYYRFLLKNTPSVRKIHLVVGPSYIHLDRLLEEIQKDKHAEVYHNVKSTELIKLLYSNDFAIVSASTISIECIKIGIPLYLVKTAENQVGNYNYLLSKGCAAKAETINNYSFSSGEKMLKCQSIEFGTGIEENLKIIFEEALNCKAQ